jgi:hypothetical protein
MSGRRRRATGALAVRLLVFVGATALGACSGAGGTGGAGGGGEVPGRSDVPVIGLQRGGHWSVISIRPPHLSGPLFHLQLRNNVLTGAVSGGTAPAGTLRVSITKDGAEGFGPLGPVALDFNTDESSTVAEGTWNGGRVHLVFARESLHGTVTTNSFFHSRSAGNNLTSSDTSRVRRMGRQSDYADPPPMDLSCEYYLDTVSTDGALNGGSTCAGMPQQTRLEVPALAKTWLTHAELVTILIAVLSSPPVVVAEDYGPRFEPPSTSSPFRR